MKVEILLVNHKSCRPLTRGSTQPPKNEPLGTVRRPVILKSAAWMASPSLRSSSSSTSNLAPSLVSTFFWGGEGGVGGG